MRPDLDFGKITAFDGSQDMAFEELVCQLARTECSHLGDFCRVEGAGGDGGVESYLTLPNGTVYGWQAKYYLDDKGLSSSRKAKIRDSLETTLRVHPTCQRWYLALPRNLSAKTSRQGETDRDWWDGLKRLYDIELVLWDKSTLVDKLMRPENRGRILYWFDALTFSKRWFEVRFQDRLSQLEGRYIPGLHVPGEVDSSLLCSVMGALVNETGLKSYQDSVSALEKAANLLLPHMSSKAFRHILPVVKIWQKAGSLLKHLVKEMQVFAGRPISEAEAKLANLIVQRYYNSFSSLANKGLLASEFAFSRARKLDGPERPRRFNNDPHVEEYIYQGYELEETLSNYYLVWRNVPDILQNDFVYSPWALSGMHLTRLPENDFDLSTSDDQDFESWLLEDEMDEETIEHNFSHREEESPSVSRVRANVRGSHPMDPVEESFSELISYAQRQAQESHERDQRQFLFEYSVVDCIRSAQTLFLELWNTFMPAMAVTRVIAPPGTGKTHLLADVTRRLVEADRPVLLFSGDMFQPNRTLESSILDALRLQAVSWDDFVGALEVAAETTRSKAVIIIDALNESPSYTVWTTWLPAFERQFHVSNHLALILSCRSNYTDVIWSNGLPKDGTIRLHHSERTVDNMIKRYEQVYHLRIAFTSPSDKEIFGQPLYLRLFCDVHGDLARTEPVQVAASRGSILSTPPQGGDRHRAPLAGDSCRLPTAILSGGVTGGLVS